MITSLGFHYIVGHYQGIFQRNIVKQGLPSFEKGFHSIAT